MHVWFNVHALRHELENLSSIVKATDKCIKTRASVPQKEPIYKSDKSPRLPKPYHLCMHTRSIKVSGTVVRVRPPFQGIGSCYTFYQVGYSRFNFFGTLHSLVELVHHVVATVLACHISLAIWWKSTQYTQSPTNTTPHAWANMECKPLTAINYHSPTQQKLYNLCATASMKIRNQAVNILTPILITQLCYWCWHDAKMSNKCHKAIFIHNDRGGLLYSFLRSSELTSPSQDAYDPSVHYIVSTGCSSKQQVTTHNGTCISE